MHVLPMVPMPKIHLCIKAFNGINMTYSFVVKVPCSTTTLYILLTSTTLQKYTLNTIILWSEIREQINGTESYQSQQKKQAS